MRETAHYFTLVRSEGAGAGRRRGAFRSAEHRIVAAGSAAREEAKGKGCRVLAPPVIG